SSSGWGRQTTPARSVARLTFAATTPSTFVRARSTRATHAAQVMPATDSSAAAVPAASGWGVLAAPRGGAADVTLDMSGSRPVLQGFHELLDDRVGVAALRGGGDVIAHVGLEHGLGDLPQGPLDRAELLEDVDAVDALVLEHAEHAVDVAADALEPQRGVLTGLRVEVEVLAAGVGSDQTVGGRGALHPCAGAAS